MRFAAHPLSALRDECLGLIRNYSLSPLRQNTKISIIFTSRKSCPNRTRRGARQLVSGAPRLTRSAPGSQGQAHGAYCLGRDAWRGPVDARARSVWLCSTVPTSIRSMGIDKCVGDQAILPIQRAELPSRGMLIGRHVLIWSQPRLPEDWHTSMTRGHPLVPFSQAKAKGKQDHCIPPVHLTSVFAHSTLRLGSLAAQVRDRTKLSTVQYIASVLPLQVLAGGCGRKIKQWSAIV
jgi:hypothetical protein